MRLYSVQFPAVLVAIDLNSWEMELSWFKYSAPSSSLVVAFGSRVGLGLPVVFLQDVREAFKATDITGYVDWDLSSPDLKMCPCRKQMIER